MYFDADHLNSQTYYVASKAKLYFYMVVNVVWWWPTDHSRLWSSSPTRTGRLRPLTIGPRLKKFPEIMGKGMEAVYKWAEDKEKKRKA